MIANKVVEITDANAEQRVTELLDSSYQGVKRLFVFAYDNTAGEDQVSVDSFKKYFLPRVKIEDYYKVRKVSTGQGDDYTTGYLLYFAYFEKNYRLIAADLSNKKLYMLIQEQINRLSLLVK